MIPSAGILIISLLIAWFEIPKLKQDKATKEMIVFCFFLISGTVLSILSALRITIPNPVNWLIFLFEPVSKWIERLLT
ncbi:hypothetical protein HHO41_02600 [Bacillus sp. DNRA2]|uniref:hypothetical protein n=1 Tax=Bacillus sp. DNRA2 TaxID=2723053 RepID=UPI00145ED74D|nr:hypothetical protein [Bacillus sp. DNRA2]NMD69163.1 hypothetical protein [Bacillus sp. DNRA2]